MPYETQSLVEDLDYHLRLVEAGRRIAFADCTRVRAEMPTGGRGRLDPDGAMGGRASADRDRQSATTGAGAMFDKPRLIEPALELLLMPLAFHVSLLVVIALMPFTFARNVSPWVDRGRPRHGRNNRGRRRLGRFRSAAECAPLYCLETRRLAENPAIGAGRGPWIRTER